MFTALGICALLYMLVAVAVIMVIPEGDLTKPTNPDAGILLDVVKVGAPGIPIDNIFPFLTVFAVGNTALINMLMASRLVYGMAKQEVLPPFLGKVLPGRRSPWTAIAFTTVLAMGLIVYVTTQSDSNIVSALSGHHRPAAAVRLLGRQHRLPGAAPRGHGSRLPRTDGRSRCWVRCSPPPWSDRGPATPRTTSSTASPPACSSSVSCSGRSPGWPTGALRAKKTGFRDIEHLEE